MFGDIMLGASAAGFAGEGEFVRGLLPFGFGRPGAGGFGEGGFDCGRMRDGGFVFGVVVVIVVVCVLEAARRGRGEWW